MVMNEGLSKFLRLEVTPSEVVFEIGMDDFDFTLKTITISFIIHFGRFSRPLLKKWIYTELKRECWLK